MMKVGSFVALCTCIVLLQCSDAYVDQILYHPVEPKNADCKNCDLIQLPDGSFFVKTCDPYAKNKCGSDSLESYDCCVGYQLMRESRDTPQARDKCKDRFKPWTKCLQQISLFNGGQEMAEKIRTLLDEKLNPQDKYTIFFALEDGTENDKLRIHDDFHVVKGKFYSHDLYHGIKLESKLIENHVHQVSRVNRSLLFDCTELIEADRECANGVIHLLRKPLKIAQPTGNVSLLAQLETNEETLEFAKDLPNDLREKLASTYQENRFTIFAPAKEAWTEIKASYSPWAVSEIAKNQVVEDLYCLTGLYKKYSVFSPFQQKFFFLENDGVKTINARCNNSQVIENWDTVRPNGVIHRTAGPIIPEHVMKTPCKEWLDANNIGRWYSYLKECELFVQEGHNYSYLYPVDSSFDWWENFEPLKKEYKRFMEDAEYRCKTVRYHIMQTDKEPSVDGKRFNESVPFLTNNKDPNQWQSVYHGPFEEGNVVWFHYGRALDEKPLDFRGSWFIRIDKVLVMPEFTISDYVKSREDLKTTDKLIVKSEFNQDYFKVNQPRNLYLVSADANIKDIFDSEGNVATSGEWDPQLAKNYNLMHTVPNYLWGGQIGYFQPGRDYQHQNGLDVPLIFRRDKENPDQMRIGYAELNFDEWPKVLEFNHRAIDGIVWVLDGPLPTPGRPARCTTDYKGELPDCLRDKDLDTWWNYLKECDLYMEADGKYTILIPVNDAFNWWKGYESFGKEHQRFLDEKAYRCQVIRYHIVRSDKGPAGDTSKVNETIAHRTNNRENAPLHLSVYETEDKSPHNLSTSVWFHYGKVMDKTPIRVNDDWITRVDHVLMIPEIRIVKYVELRDDSGEFVKLHANTEADKFFQKNGYMNLHFVVKDSDLPEGMIANLDPDASRSFLNTHTVPKYLWGSDIGYFEHGKQYSHASSEPGRQIGFLRRMEDDKDVMRVGLLDTDPEQWAKVLEFNHRAIDGIVWVLDKPLMAVQDPCSKLGKVDTKADDVPKCVGDVSEWWKAVKECDLYIDPSKEYTFLLPTNAAFDWWRNYPDFQKELERFQTDKEYRCAVIRYHIMESKENPARDSAQSNKTVHFITNNRGHYAPQWQSVYEGADESPYDHPNQRWYHYGRVVDKEPYAYEKAWLSRIDKVLMLPEKNVTDIVASRDKMKIFANIHEQSNAREYFDKRAPRNLHLVIRDADMTGHEVDPEKYGEFMRLHTIPNYLWGSDIGYYSEEGEYRYVNDLGMPLIFRRKTVDGKSVLQIGYEGLDDAQWSTVVEYNIRARDGIIWVLDGPLSCPEQYCPKQPACDPTKRLDFKGDFPECMIPKELQRFWDYMKDCDLYMDESKNYHILTPVNSAFDWFAESKFFAEEWKRFQADKEYRCQVVRYHIMESQDKPTSEYPEMNRTVHFRTNNRGSVAPLWESFYHGPGNSDYNAPGNYWYHYARVMDREPLSFVGSWLTRLDKVLIFPERNITEFLESDKEFSAIYSLHKKSGHMEYVATQAPRTLFLIVRDEGLKELFDSEGRAQSPLPEVPILEDSDGILEKQFEEEYSKKMPPTFKSDYALNFTMWHTIPNYFWGADLGYYQLNRDYRIKNSRDFEFIFRRTGESEMVIGYDGLEQAKWSQVTSFNHHMRDGMVWILDKAIPCIGCKPIVRIDVDLYSLHVAACQTDHLASGTVDKKVFSSKMTEIADENPNMCASVHTGDYINHRIVD